MEYDPSQPNNYKHWSTEEIYVKMDHGKTLKRRSKIVALVNMVEDFDEECEEDIREEAKKYGKILDLALYLPSNDSKVEIYLMFEDEVSAELFVKTMDGRYYDKHKISAFFYPENEFVSNNLGKSDFFISRDQCE